MKKQLAIFGSTGSIGTSTLEVVRHHPDRLAVRSLAAFGRDLDTLSKQVEEFQPAVVAIYDEDAASRFHGRVPRDVSVLSGTEGLEAMAVEPEADRVVAAMVGAVGLRPVYVALSAGKPVALANKESLVVAGRLLMDLSQDNSAEILPIDSEHVALHQALRGGEHGEVRRLVLTASGGPFRTRDRSTFSEIRPEEALRHPTWSMGPKITIDSATLMNKGLELIEASHLFGMSAERIEVVVHPQSLVHSMVEFRDGSWLAQMSVNDMIFPIEYALSYPERWDNEFPRLDPQALGQLEFEPVDEVAFPAIELARHAAAMGESAPAVMNAANEEAVRAFLAGKISFPAIVGAVEETLASHQAVDLNHIEDALEWDLWGRNRALEILDRLAH